MGPRHGGRTDLFQTNGRAKIAPRRMTECLVPEIRWCRAKRTQLFPSFLENATLIEDLRRKRRLYFHEAHPARLQRSSLPNSTKLRCGLISINQSQIPPQQNCW